MRTSYFTFGQAHIHKVDSIIYDKDCVLKIVANEPRDVMFESFGPKWAFEYDEPPDIKYFPRGIFDHWQNPKETTQSTIPTNP